VDVLPRDIATPPRVLGSDLIDYLITSANLQGDSDDRHLWTRAADVIDSAHLYTAALDATPDWSVIRWIPAEESGLPTVILFSEGANTTVMIRHARGGPSTRCR